MWFCTETVKLLHNQLNSKTKIATKITEINAFTLFLFKVKIVKIYTLLVCNIFGPKIQSCNFFDKSQVCTYHVRNFLWGQNFCRSFLFYLNESFLAVSEIILAVLAAISTSTIHYDPCEIYMLTFEMSISQQIASNFP